MCIYTVHCLHGRSRLRIRISIARQQRSLSLRTYIHGFVGDRLYNGSPYAVGLLSVCLSCLSVTLVYCGQAVRWIKMKLVMQVGLVPGNIVLDGDPAPAPPKRGQSPQFSAHVYCGQTAGWIKMTLGMEVGLSPGHIVLDGDPAPLPKGGTAPNFRPVCCGQTTGWIKMPLGREVGLGPGHIVLHGDAAAAKRGTAPIFGKCLLWPNGRPSQLQLSTC